MNSPIIGGGRASRAATGGGWKSASPTGAATGVASPAGAILYASLKEAENPTNAVQFTINPEKIVLSHTAKWTEISSTSAGANGSGEDGSADGGTTAPPGQVVLNQETRLQEVGATTFDLSDLTFSGSGVAKTCKQLLDWTNPTAASVQAKNPKIPLLIFNWGTLNYRVFLTTATVTYERFTPGGKPVRAKATLKCTLNPPLPTPTNPTSGGIQGRRSHMLVAGENLQHIAMASYGRPGAWRALAAANGIEDPLALRPGTVIYLPAPTELAELAGRSPG